jgi:multidrug efflux pump
LSQQHPTAPAGWGDFDIFGLPLPEPSSLDAAPPAGAGAGAASCAQVAVAGVLFGLQAMGLNQSIYSQIGFIMLIGLAAKNGILIVEFINQLRDEGVPFVEAVLEASSQRLRPIIMTALATVMGALPLMLSHGAGAETRMVVGVVIVFGVSLATLVTLILVPLTYVLISRRTGSPEAVSRKLDALLIEGAGDLPHEN